MATAKRRSLSFRLVDEQMNNHDRCNKMLYVLLDTTWRTFCSRLRLLTTLIKIKLLKKSHVQKHAHLATYTTANVLASLGKTHNPTSSKLAGHTETAIY